MKIAKIAAHSGPSILPRNNAINPAMVSDKKLNTGTDCMISINGMMMRSARLLLAARVPKIKVNNNEKNRAMNILKTV